MSCGSLGSVVSHGREGGEELWVDVVLSFCLDVVWIWTRDPEATCMFLLFPETK